MKNKRIVIIFVTGFAVAILGALISMLTGSRGAWFLVLDVVQAIGLIVGFGFLTFYFIKYAGLFRRKKGR